MQILLPQNKAITIRRCIFKLKWIPPHPPSLLQGLVGGGHWEERMWFIPSLSTCFWSIRHQQYNDEWYQSFSLKLWSRRNYESWIVFKERRLAFGLSKLPCMKLLDRLSTPRFLEQPCYDDCIYYNIFCGRHPSFPFPALFFFVALVVTL